MQTELFQKVSHKKILQYLFTGIVRALQSNRQICFKIVDTLTGINNLHYNGYYTTEIKQCQGVDEKGMCQVKVGNNLQNCHNAQNQIEQSVKGLVREMFLSHFKLGGTVTFPENS